MNRKEFMAQLERLLGELPENERLEALRFYNDYFDEAGPENEARVIQELGSPGKVAAVIRANLDGNQDQGEFTEQGYRDNVQGSTPNYPGPVKPTSQGRTGSRIFGNRQRTAERTGAGAGNAAGYSTAGADGPGGGAYGRAAGNTTGYGPQNSGTTGSSRSYGPQAPRQKRGAGGWALLIILLIFASPVLLGIGGGILGLIGGLAGGFLGLLAACIGGGIGLTVGGVALFVESIVQLFHSPAAGLVGMGGGLIFTALGILLLLAFAWLAFRLLPRIFRAVVNFISRVAHRGRGGNRA